jgi:hypothetical protein
MKHSKNTTGVHPHPQIPASHRRRKIPKIQNHPKSNPI